MSTSLILRETSWTGNCICMGGARTHSPTSILAYVWEGQGHSTYQLTGIYLCEGPGRIHHSAYWHICMGGAKNTPPISLLTYMYGDYGRGRDRFTNQLTGICKGGAGTHHLLTYWCQTSAPMGPRCGRRQVHHGSKRRKFLLTLFDWRPWS